MKCVESKKNRLYLNAAKSARETPEKSEPPAMTRRVKTNDRVIHFTDFSFEWHFNDCDSSLWILVDSLKMARENCEAPGLIINRRARSGMPRHEMNWNHDISQVRSSWQVKWYSAQNVRWINDPEKSHLFIAQLKVEILMSGKNLNDLQTRMAHKRSFKCMHTRKSTFHSGYVSALFREIYCEAKPAREKCAN